MDAEALRQAVAQASFGALWVGYKVFEVIGGILLILSGLYLLNAYFIIIPVLAA